MRRSRPILAAGAALMLTGCAATHVEDAWQCPLAQGARCTSVAGADPMVPDEAGGDEAARDAPVLPGPLYRPRAPDGPGAQAESERPCGAGCGGGFDPVGWLSGWLARIAPEDAAAPAPSGRGGTDAGGEAASGNLAAATPDEVADAAGPQDRSGGPAAEAEGASASALPHGREAAAVAPSGGVFPAPGGAPLAGEPVPAEPAADDGALRSAEVIGRIWIAPFVDADGHYREASWVRTVLEPAGWRTP